MIRMLEPNMTKSLKANIAWNFAYKALMIAAPLVTVPYVSRTLNVAQMGEYSYTYSITYYFTLFAALGMSNYGVRLIAQAGDNRKERSGRFWSAWASQACVSLPVCLAYAAYLLIGPAGGREVGLIWGLWIAAVALDVSWLFFGVEDFRFPTIRNFVTKVLGLVIIFLFCRDEGDLWAYVLGTSMGFFANALLVLPFVFRYVDFVRPTWSTVRCHFAPNLRLFAPIAAISLYMSFDKVLLGSIAGMEQAGYFEYADKMARVPLAAVTAVCAAMLPRMTMNLSSGKIQAALSLFDRSFRLVVVVAIGSAFGIVAVSSELVPVFLGPGYDFCVSVMMVLAVALPIISSSNVIGGQYMLPAQMDKPYTRSVLIGAVVNLVLCLLLLGKMGALGAAIATVVTEAAVLAYQCWAVRERISLVRYVRWAMPFVFIGFAMAMSVRLLSGCLLDIWGLGWGVLIVEIAVAVFMYGGAAVAWCLAMYGAVDLGEILGGRSGMAP